MIDFASFVGKKVIVQFRNRDAWLTVHVDRGKPAIAAILNDQEQPQMIPAPFLMGEVVDRGEESFVLVVLDENKRKLEVAVNPDAVLTVTSVVEESPVLLAAS